MSNSKPGTVLHIIDTGGPGGAETMFAELASRLDGSPLHSIVAVSREGWLANRLRENSLSPEIVAPTGAFDIRFLRQLAGIVRQHDVRLIHAHLLGATVYAAIVGLLLRIPVIGVFHGPSDLTGEQRFKRLKCWLLTRACHSIVAVSDSTLNELEAFGIARDKISLIRNGIDTGRFVPARSSALKDELGLKSDKFLVGALGNIRTPKDYPTLIKAARTVIDSLPGAHFAIVGEGNEESMADLISIRRSLGLEQHVHFLGFRAVNQELLGSFDLFVSSSSSEGLPLSFLEAMSSGLCVVATRSGGAQEVIEHERTGLLVPTRDPEALGRAIVAALSRPEFAAGLAEAGRRKVLDEFSLDGSVARYRSLYSECLESE